MSDGTVSQAPCMATGCVDPLDCGSARGCWYLRPQSQRPALGPRDLNRYVRVYTAQGDHVAAEGRIVAYAGEPTVVIEQVDGSHVSWIASLPWEPLDEKEPPRDRAAANAVAWLQSLPRFDDTDTGARKVQDPPA